MPNVAVRFDKVTLDPVTHAEMVRVLHGGDEVWATGNLKVGATDHLMRQRITAWPEAEVELGRAMMTQLDVPDGSSVQVRFKLEISRSAGGAELVADRIVQPLASPYYTQAGRSSHTSDGGLGYTLGWTFVNMETPLVVERTSCARRPEDAPRNCMATVAAPTNCWQYEPVHPDALVVARSEYTAPVADFLNWKPGNGVAHENITPRPHRCRDRDDVNAIVLHETAGWRADDPARDIRAHFVVHTDGSVVQLYDAVQYVYHANRRNSISVGIEVANLGFVELDPGDDHDHYTPPAHVTNREQRELIVAWNMWPMNPPHWRYIVPPLVQLESTYQLVRHLMHHLPVPADWLSLDHPEADHLFLMWRWEAQYNAAGAAGDRPGIYSHLNIAGARVHTDGGFIALYTWLRHVHGRDPAAARTDAMQLIRDHLVRVSGRKYVDISGV